MLRNKGGRESPAPAKKRKNMENLTEIKIIVCRSHSRYRRAVYRVGFISFITTALRCVRRSVVYVCSILGKCVYSVTES